MRGGPSAASPARRPPEPEPEAKPAAPPAARSGRAPPPPPPAQAAKVLTQEPKPDEPVDLTGNTIVQGNADTYAGGFTTANGTSSAAVNAAAEPHGRAGRDGAGAGAAAVPAPDLSRAALHRRTGRGAAPSPRRRTRRRWTRRT